MTYLTSKEEIIKCPISGTETEVKVVYANGALPNWTNLKKPTSITSCKESYKHCQAFCSCLDSIMQS